jgi:predicted helicase
MRQSLMRSFEQIYVLDLHGNAKKKERSPDGSKDENVFDIEQGVAISLFVKRPGLERGVWRGDLWGKRLEKYQTASEATLQNSGVVSVRPTAPHYLILNQNEAVREVYERGKSIKDIFIEGGTGIITKRDSLTIKYSPTEIWKTIKEFVRLEPEEARAQFKLPADVRDWKVADAQADVLQDGPEQKKIREIRYRPFDNRFTYYTGRARGFLGWPVERIAQHFDYQNVGLITSRLT